MGEFMKDKIRESFLLKRNNISKEDLEEKSRKIQKRLFNLPEFVNSKKILFYIDIGSEVKTKKIIKEAMKKGKNIVLPITDLKEKKLILSEINDLDKGLERGAFGIPEPKSIKEVNIKDIDLVIVPGIAFDKKGNRVGYGHGYYDKLINSTNKKLICIALAFESQIVSNIPKEQHDSSLSKIITENRVISS